MIRRVVHHACLAVALFAPLSSCAPEAPTSDQISARADRLQGCGLNYTHSYQQSGAKGFGSETSRKTLDELASLGIRALNVASFGWMSSTSSAEVRYSTANQARLAGVAKNARARGMTLILRAHLWISGGAWVAEIAPTDEAGGWDAWFNSYEAYLLHNAALARDIGADRFVVGVELRSATRARPARWRAMIAKVRALYRGPVTYSATYDEAESLAFWDALDDIGVNMYAPLTKSANPTQASVEAEARRWLVRFEALASRHGKTLLLTEAGFPNYEGALKTPYMWASQAGVSTPTVTGDLHQVMGYRALLATFGRSAAVERIYWWKWFSNPDTNEEGPVGYWPRGKPAEQVLRSACAR